MKWMKRSEKRKFYTGWAHASSNRKLSINCWSIHLTPVNDGCHRNVLNIIFNEYILQFVQRNEIMFMEFVRVDVNNFDDSSLSFFLKDKKQLNVSTTPYINCCGFCFVFLLFFDYVWLQLIIAISASEITLSIWK